jgi:hypothetical protein
MLIASSRFQLRRSSPTNESPLALTILELQVSANAQLTPTASREPAAVLRRKASTADAPPARPYPALTLSAPIDWTNEAMLVARAAVARHVQTGSYRSLSTHPAGVDLPNPDPTQRAGSSQSFEGGEVISWVDDRCFYTNHGWVPYQIIPPAQKVCKDPPRRD